MQKLPSLSSLKDVLFGRSSASDAPGYQPDEEVSTQSSDEANEPIDLTQEPYRAPRPTVAMDPQKRFIQEAQSFYRYDATASEEESSWAIDQLRKLGLLAPEFAKVAGNNPALQEQALAATKLHLDKQGGAINEDVLREGLMTLMKNPPVPQTVPGERRDAYFDRIYANLPEKPTYDPQELLVQGLSALLAGGRSGQAGNILSRSIGLTQNRMQGEYQTQVQNAEIQSKRAAAEYQAEMSDVQLMNQAAQARYANEVAMQREQLDDVKEDKKEAKLDERYYRGLFYNANNPGEVLDAAEALGWDRAFDEKQNLVQEGTDPRVWAAYSEWKAKNEIAKQREARLLQSEMDDQKERELNGFRKDLAAAMQYTQNLSPKLAQQFEDVRQELLDRYPGSSLPPVIDAPSFRAEAQQFSEQMARDKFKHLQDQDVKRWAHAATMASIAKQRLELAKRSGQGVAGSVVNETTRRQRESKIVEAISVALDKEAAIAERAKARQELNAAYEDARKRASNKNLPYNETTLARNEAVEKAKQLAQYDEETARLKGQAAGARSVYNSLIARWGADGLKGLPSDDAVEIPPTVVNPVFSGGSRYLDGMPYRQTPTAYPPGVTIKKTG